MDLPNVEHIAHVLSQNNMLGGRTPYPYSAAQAAVFRSMLATKRGAYETLHYLDALVEAPVFAERAGRETHKQAERFERQILLGDHDAVITGLSLGQYAHLREVVYALRQLHPRRARDLYLERHYALVGGK